MSGSNLGFMLGPSIGGWLYESGGARLPFQLVTILAVAAGLGFFWLRLPPPVAAREPLPFRSLIRMPAVASCAVVVAVASATFSMFEPVLALFLSSSLQLSPGRVGLVFGAAAVASAALHPIYGRLADRYGGRRLMLDRPDRRIRGDAVSRSRRNVSGRCDAVCAAGRDALAGGDAVSDVYG